VPVPWRASSLRTIAASEDIVVIVGDKRGVSTGIVVDHSRAKVLRFETLARPL
jgi:hypothetical protein